jgi:hypothetical protein
VVRNVLRMVMCLSLFGAAAVAAQRGAEGTPPGEQFVGTWTGTWEGGGGTGGIELTLEKAKDGSIAGRVSVTGEPSYKTAIGKLSFEGSKMTAQYDFPADESIAVMSVTTFEGNTGKGTWAARVKASGEDVATGTWTMSRK